LPILKTRGEIISIMLFTGNVKHYLPEYILLKTTNGERIKAYINEHRTQERKKLNSFNEGDCVILHYREGASHNYFEKLRKVDEDFDVSHKYKKLKKRRKHSRRKRI
jgi:hypothetical protein